jgi:hypothetical protein
VVGPQKKRIEEKKLNVEQTWFPKKKKITKYKKERGRKEEGRRRMVMRMR